jgi:transcription elongation factor GreA
MAREVQVTKEGLRRLEATLREERRRLEEATAILQELTTTSDDYEDSGLEDARQEKARLEARVDDLEDQLRRAVVIEAHERSAVDLGSVVTLQSGAEELQVQLVSPVEAEVVAEEIPHISDASPLGRALLGRKVGETFEVVAGHRTTAYTVLEIQ